MLMIMGVVMMVAQCTFAIWCLLNLRDVVTCQHTHCTMMLQLMHYMKLAFNIYCGTNYFSNIKNSLPD